MSQRAPRPQTEDISPTRRVPKVLDGAAGVLRNEHYLFLVEGDSDGRVNVARLNRHSAFREKTRWSRNKLTREVKNRLSNFRRSVPFQRLTLSPAENSDTVLAPTPRGQAEIIIAIGLLIIFVFFMLWFLRVF